MDSKISNFLTTHRISVLTTLLKDGSPHSATVHFSHNENPFEFYFSTENTSRKVQSILDGSSSKASVVIGFSEEEWLTFQMEGEVRAVLDKNELVAGQNIHYAKITQAEKYKDSPKTIFLKFTPTWWRFSDYNTRPPMTISSDKE